MKIIVNRGFENMLARVVVFKNARPIIVCPIQKDFCEMDAKEGDRIEIKLKALGMISQTLASFTYQEGKDTIYIYSPRYCVNGGRWQAIAYYLILVCFLLFFKP